MKNIPDGQLIRVQPSPLYIGEIYSSSMPTMDEITRLAMPKPRNDYTLYHGSPSTYPKTKIYKPLLLASNAPDIPTESDDDIEQTKSLGDCVWNCILKQYGFDGLAAGIAGGTILGSTTIPKSWVKMPSGSLGSGRITSIPSIIQFKSKQKGSIFNNKFLNNEFMHGKESDPGKFIRVPKISPKRFLTKKGLDKISQRVITKGALRFAGRWIPGLGWALLALDVAMISKCSYDCYNSDDNRPMS